MQAAHTDRAVKITGASDRNLFGVLDQCQLFLMPSVNIYNNISVFLTIQIKHFRVSTMTGNVSLCKKSARKMSTFSVTFYVLD
jgi:hypothetical protein